MALWADGCDDDKAAQAFILWFYKHCSKKLWRPTFEAAKTAAKACPATPLSASFTSHSSAKDDDGDVDINPDVTGYTSDEYLDANINTTSNDPPD